VLFSDKSAENPTKDLSDASEDGDEPIIETDSFLRTSHDEYLDDTHYSDEENSVDGNIFTDNSSLTSNESTTDYEDDKIDHPKHEDFTHGQNNDNSIMFEASKLTILDVMEMIMGVLRAI